MPRKPRMYLPGVPCHIIQRGNNRGATFFAEQDYQFYLECLYDAAMKYHVKIHAYVLMTNHLLFSDVLLLFIFLRFILKKKIINTVVNFTFCASPQRQ